MRFSDFARCTPSQFKAIYDTWQAKEQQAVRLTWDSARMIGWCVLSPYKKWLKPTDILTFEWDKKEPQNAALKSSREDFENAMALYGH